MNDNTKNAWFKRCLTAVACACLGVANAEPSAHNMLPEKPKDEAGPFGLGGMYYYGETMYNLGIVRLNTHNIYAQFGASYQSQNNQSGKVWDTTYEAGYLLHPKDNVNIMIGAQYSHQDPATSALVARKSFGPEVGVQFKIYDGHLVPFMTIFPYQRARSTNNVYDNVYMGGGTIGFLYMF